VVSEWTLHTSVTEPFYGALSRNVQILVTVQVDSYVGSRDLTG
jgi:hypothetical protein